MVAYAFILSNSFAVTVEPVAVRSSSGDENGARIQVRRVNGTAESSLHLGEPVWRGDLFKLTDGPPGNWDRAHYHPRFSGYAAGERQFDEELKKDPINWALVQLADLHSLARNADASDLAAVANDLQPQLDGVRDEIRLALHKCAAIAPR